MKNTYYVVRHGQSEGNINDSVTGGNPPLTEHGMRQAKELAQLLANIQIHQIFSSNLIRAKQTAAIIAATKNLIPEENQIIRERFFGSLEGLPGDYIKENYQEKINQFDQLSLNKQLQWRIVDDMESLEEVLQRALPFFDLTADLSQEKSILLVTHANVIIALLAHFGFINSVNELPYGSIKNTSYIKIEKSPDNCQIIDTYGISKKTNV